MKKSTKCPRCDHERPCPCGLPDEVLAALASAGWKGGRVELIWEDLTAFRLTDEEGQGSTVAFLAEAQLGPIVLLPHWFLLVTENYLVAYAPGNDWCPICTPSRAREPVA